MKFFIVLTALCAGLLFPVRQSVAAGETLSPVAEATADVARWNSAVAQGNLNGILSLFTQDAMVIEPAGQVAHNSGEIRDFWKSMLDAPQGMSQFRLVKARRESEDTVVTRMEVIADKPLGKPTGSHLSYHYQGLVNHVLKQQADGSWKVQVQRWNDGTRLVEE